MSNESELTANSVSGLAELLAERIRESGKITFHDWMKEALYHPKLGYYNRADRKRWGREGDYVTSPERSKLFAATFARYFATLYKRLGQPAELKIVEMGAGNGEFAAGVLDTFKRCFPALFNLTAYLIIERSQVSRQLAADRLLEFRDRVDFVECHGSGPWECGILFSNELLDAFPVHRLTVCHGDLKELFVDLNVDGKFSWVASEPSSNEIIDTYKNQLPQLEEGQVIELNPGISDWYKTVGSILSTGYLITVDYGAESADLYSISNRPSGTLRAFRRHGFVDDVLSEPGENDITTTVDWTFVRALGEQNGFEVAQFDRLDRFLMHAGILDELEYCLNEATSEAEKSALTTSAREMILPGAMASSFQVLVQRF